MVGVYTFGLFEMSLAIKRRMFWCVRLLLSFLCSAAIQEGISSGVVPWRRQTDRQTDRYICSYTLCRRVRNSCIYAAHINPSLNRSSNAIKISNGIMFDFTQDCHIYEIYAVLCRNRRLFRSVFQSHCCVQSTVSLNFR